MKTVYVIWKDVDDGMWHPVARLRRLESGYSLNYTKGASHENFTPFPRMGDLSEVYYSSTLFSFFSNRLIPENRPEFKTMLGWLNISPKNYDILDILSVSGGARKTDEFRIVSHPTSCDTKYKIKFFVSGIGHLPIESKDKIGSIKSGDKLYFKFEDKNCHDSHAILIQTKNKLKVGYCPKYMNCDVRALLESPEFSEYELNVVKVNVDAPSQFKLLCEFNTAWPEDFVPFMSGDYLEYAI